MSVSDDVSFTPVKPSAQIISAVQIECRVVLHQSMFCLIHCYDSNQTEIKTFQVQLSQDEYNAWTSDDDMEALILSKVGLVKA